MSQDVFERIQTKRPSLITLLAKVETKLSKLGTRNAIRPSKFCSFVGSDPDTISVLLEDLHQEGLLEKKIGCICPQCDVLIDSEIDDEERRICDLCHRAYFDARLGREECYYLTRPLVLRSQRGTHMQSKSAENPLNDESGRRYAKIVPWRTLRSEDYTIEFPTLNAGVKNDALDKLQKYGIALLRWHGDSPSEQRLESLENWIGPARIRQNDFEGKVKSLVPKYDVEPNTGDSAKRLAPHVDGTQDPYTPAVLAFQYDYSPTWGAESTFFDMAAILSDMPTDLLERTLTALALNNCATCTKSKGAWSQTFNGPLVRAVFGGQAISIRLREDDLLKVTPACQAEFDLLKSTVSAWANKHVLRYTPHEGDVVIFDNWRLLHGREAIGGRHQRIHNRLWIDKLSPEYDGKYLLGVRPIPAGLMAAIERANLEK
jgi:alpha-ketoglutarate-dependent taurine dioxygenase